MKTSIGFLPTRFWSLVVLIFAGINLFVLPPFMKLYAEPPANPNPIPWVTNAPINAVAPAGAVTYIGGDFSYVGPNTGYGAAIDLATGAPKTPYARVNSIVATVVPDGLGGWYIGGSFQKVCGVERWNIAHILADGSPDPSWSPGVNTNGEVWALALSGGVLYVGGTFTNIGGQPRNYIAAIDTATGLATPWDPNADNGVWALAVSGTTVYAGGDFTNIGSQPRDKIAALDTTTGLATSWDPGASYAARIFSLSLSGGIVYAGGEFTNIGGQARTNIAALDATTGLATLWNPNASYVVRALAISGGVVYAGGNFDRIGGQTRICIAALDATTGSATTWNPTADGGVYALTESNGIVYAGGDFNNIGGERRNNIAALDATTGAATSWNPNTIARVSALSVSGNEIYVGGYFGSIGGKERNFLAAINNVTGQATSWNPNPSLYVRTLAVSGGAVYAGGDFTFIGGQPRSYIAALDTATGLATSWDPNADAPVSVLMESGGIIYAGGYFTAIGNANRNYIAALDATTGLATSWDPNADKPVRTLAEGGGMIYAGGYFTAIGNANRNYIAALDATTGVAIPNWDPQFDYASTEVYALAENNGVLYVGGFFWNIGGVWRNNIAAFDALTGSLTSWDPNASGPVNALAVKQGVVFAGGGFNFMGTNPSYPQGTYSQNYFAQFGRSFPLLADLVDFSDDGKPDLLWRNFTTGRTTIWYMDYVNGPAWNGIYADIAPPLSDPDWILVGVADFSGDGKPDLLWRNITTGRATIWYMDYVNGPAWSGTYADISPTFSDWSWTITGR